MTRSMVKSRLHHDIAHLHPPTNVPMKFQLPTTFLRYIQDNLFLHRMPTHPDTIGENNTQTALKGCGVKIVIIKIYKIENFNYLNLKILIT